MFRSLAFRACYYVASAFFVLTSLPLLLLPSRRPVRRWVRSYCRLMVRLMRGVAGVDVRVGGREHLPDGPCVIAAKHQSWGDGFVMFAAVPDLAFVTGDHLLRYPLLGVVLRGLGAVVVDNCGGAAARGRLVAREAARAREEGRPILIYPEGHLSAVGTHHRYRKGVWHLARAYGAPVVPVATDLGLRWPLQQVALRPGPCTVEFLTPIEAGEDKDAFMAELEARIEGRSLALLSEQAAAGTLPDDQLLALSTEASA